MIVTRKMGLSEKLTVLTVLAVLLLGAFGAYFAFGMSPSNKASAASTSTSIGPSERLGFWIDERDMWSGAGVAWTPQQFVTNYFDTAPYPSAMLFASGMNPSGPDSPGALGEATWLGQVASLEPNANIIVIFFVNLSGGTIDGQVDQTALLQQYLSTLGSHPNIVGMEYETEYYGDTVAEEQSFYNIVTAAGYTDLGNPSHASTFTGEQFLGYSEYPYYCPWDDSVSACQEPIPTSLPSDYIGYGYGETGAPNTGPAWTQSAVLSIVNTSPANPYVFLYAEADTNNSAGGNPINVEGDFLWNSPTLRGWIWSDPTYQANFILSTGSSSTTTTTTTSPTTTTTTTTTSPTTTTTSTTHTTTTTSKTTTTTSKVTTTVTKTVTTTVTTTATTTATVTVTTTTTQTEQENTTLTETCVVTFTIVNGTVTGVSIGSCSG